MNPWSKQAAKWLKLSGKFKWTNFSSINHAAQNLVTKKSSG